MSESQTIQLYCKSCKTHFQVPEEEKDDYGCDECYDDRCDKCYDQEYDVCKTCAKIPRANGDKTSEEVAARMIKHLNPLKDLIDSKLQKSKRNK
jgi:hypothetical protein